MHGPQPPLEPGMWRIPYFNARCHLPSCPLLGPLPILPVRPVTTMAGNSTIGAPCAADYTLESPGGSSVSYQASHDTELAACTLTGEAWKACSSRLSSSSNMLLSALPSQKVEKGPATSRLGSACMKLLAPLLGELPPAMELQEATAARNSRSAPRPMGVALNMRGSTTAMTHWRPACHSSTGAPQHIPRAIPLLGGPPPCPTDSLIHRQFSFPVAGSPASSLYPVQ